MKCFTSLILAILCTWASLIHGSAQAGETIWLSADVTTYAVGETVIVKVNALSAIPIQGFTFQIRYDSACLQVVNAASPISGMNGLPLPQNMGMVDASFASTTPQSVNGILAQVRFLASATCQTNLVLESAALAIRNSSGFAVPLSGVTLGEKTIALTIEKSGGAPQATSPVIGTPLPLGPQPSSGTNFPIATIVLVGILVLVAIAMLVLFLLILKRPSGS